MNLNKVLLVGNITKDLELKTFQSGANYCSFSLATNRVYIKDNQKTQETEYHSVVVYGKMAETLTKWMSKGSQILVEGRLKTRTWESNGQKHYKTEIIAESIQFGNSPKTKKSTGNIVPEEDIKPDEVL